MSDEADPDWRIVAAASVAPLCRTLPRGAQPSGQEQSDLVSFAAGGKNEQWSSAVPRAIGGMLKYYERAATRASILTIRPKIAVFSLVSDTVPDFAFFRC